MQILPVGLTAPGLHAMQAVCSSFGSKPGGQLWHKPAAEYVCSGHGKQAVCVGFGPNPAGHALQKIPSVETKYAGQAVHEIE
jgi:hypothetical protein